MINFIFITNNPKLAKFAQDSGVQRIMVDLETEGKQARQGHLDTLISQHSFADVALVKAALGTQGDRAKLVVRLNPLSVNSQFEVDKAIELGADMLMLPMFKDAGQVQQFLELVAGRVDVIPLVETAEAAANIKAIASLPGVTEILIGLNDLHLDMGLKFMFEPVASGMVEAMVEQVQSVGKPCGFGGIARVAEGMIPGEMVLAEHVRLGSSTVILSRTFHRKSEDLDSLTANMDLQHEIEKLRFEERKLQKMAPCEWVAIHDEFCARVEKIAALRSQ